MCNDPTYFKDIVPDFTQIELGDGKIIHSRGRGRIGNLENIYFVPDLRYNLLSISYLRDLGFTISFDTGGHVIPLDIPSFLVPILTDFIKQLGIQLKCTVKRTILSYSLNHVTLTPRLYCISYSLTINHKVASMETTLNSLDDSDIFTPPIKHLLDQIPLLHIPLSN
jgi:hypothetical protein